MAPVPDGKREGPSRNDAEISDLDAPQVNIEVDSESSSSDDEASPYMGYQLLPQDPDTGGAVGVIPDPGGQQELEDIEGTFQGSLESMGQQHAVSGLIENLPPVPNTAAEERRAVWNKPLPAAQPMDPDQVHKIKNAMANFKLPTPDWARAIPEDKWKEELFLRLSPGVSTVDDTLTQDSSLNMCGDCKKEQISTTQQADLVHRASTGVQRCEETKLTSSEKVRDCEKDNT